MKKAFCAFLFLSVTTISVWSKKAEPAITEDVISIKPVEYREIEMGYQIFNGPSSISYEQMIQDVEELTYILEVGYAGYEDMLSYGFNKNKFVENVVSSFEKDTDVITRELYKTFIKNLKSYIHDSHFQILRPREQESLCTKKIVFWSDIYLEKNQNGYTVFNPNSQNIPLGTKYTDDTELLFYYPVKGENIYRLGIIQKYEEINKISHTIKFENTTSQIEFKNDGTIPDTPTKFNTFETENSAYITLNSLRLPEEDPGRNTMLLIFDKFAHCGFKYNKKQNIILDLRDNHGGDFDFLIPFYYTLFSGKDSKDSKKLREKVLSWHNHNFLEQYTVISPVSEQARYYHYQVHHDINTNNLYKTHIEKQKQNPERLFLNQKGNKGDNLFNIKKKFNGKLIILIDRNTVSAGEVSVLLAKEIFGDENVIVIGENSYGMSQYWDVITLELHNSKIGIHTAFKKSKILDNYSEWAGEGIGLYPDYWSCGSDLNETIFLLTQDQQMKTRLKNIEFRLQ